MSNALWIIINVFCLLVTFQQLRSLGQENKRRLALVPIEDKEVACLYCNLLHVTLSHVQAEVCEVGGQRIRVLWVVGLVHAACWLPLYTDTLVEWGSQQKTITHEVTLMSCHVMSCHVTCIPRCRSTSGSCTRR